MTIQNRIEAVEREVEHLKQIVRNSWDDRQKTVNRMELANRVRLMVKLKEQANG